MKEREQLRWNWADGEDTPEAWQTYLDEYPKGNRTLRNKARHRSYAARFKDAIEVGAVDMEEVNLAEDPAGPKDGWGFYADVTNKGDKPIEYLMLRISYLDGNGKPLDHREWPAVAKSLPGNLPFEEGFDKPIPPNGTRRWEWTTGETPDGWAKKVAVMPVDIKWVGVSQELPKAAKAESAE
jgi:hypothetical protein